MRSHIVWIGLLSGLASFAISCNSNPAVEIDIRSAGISSAGIRSAENDASTTSMTEQQSLKVVGASTPYPAIELLAKAFTEQSDSSAVETKFIFLDSSQSGGGIEAVKDKFVEIGTVTRSPKPEETSPYLFHREIARDALLVATHPSVSGIDNLTTADLQAIYSGAATNWQTFGGPKANIVILDRAEDTSAKRLLREYYLGKGLPNEPNAIVLNRESDVIEAVQNTPYSIGVLSLAKAIAHSLSINYISLDGIAPTAENISSGKYAMHRNLGIVWYGTPAKTTQAFLDFIASPKGHDALRQAGYVPIIQQ